MGMFEATREASHERAHSTYEAELGKLPARRQLDVHLAGRVTIEQCEQLAATAATAVATLEAGHQPCQSHPGHIAHCHEPAAADQLLNVYRYDVIMVQ